MAHMNQVMAARTETEKKESLLGLFSQMFKLRDTAEKYDFSRYFHNITHRIRGVDIAVCNLETTLAGGTPSGYPRFNSPVALADAIADAGFTCVATANNHSFDSDDVGIVKTRKNLEARGLKVAGTRKTPGEKAYALLVVKGVKVALLNFTYETAGKDGKRTLNNRPMTPDAKALLNSFCFESIEEDLKAVEQEIASARKDGAQIILMYFHWGNEYERYSNVFQKYLAWRAAHMGVDAIIGSHAHVMQELGEIRISDTKTVPVFYGLGNYIWGAPPIYERETVLNNILARLDISYDKETGRVQVEPSYIPLYIGQKGKLIETIDMQSLSTAEYDAFAERFGIHPATVLDQIRETVENRVHPVVPELHFDRIFKLRTGERLSLLTGFLPDKKYVEFRSEDTITASVTQNGFVIGNTPGYAGLTAVAADGGETVFMVQVLPGEKSQFPILVNEQNLVRDIYLPANRVGGEEYALPDKLQLCRPAAEAWVAMQNAARADGIHLNAIHATRFKIDQIKRRANYAKLYGDAAARRRYHRFGCTEHHLGTALDVAAGTYEGEKTPRAAAYQWIQNNAGNFGFVLRKVTAKIEQVVYLHLRHLEDQSLVATLTKHNISIEEYLTNYEQYKDG